MFQIGLNPYGFTHTVGLQGFGTPRANPQGTGLRGFIRIASDIGAQCLEFDGRWLAPMTDDELAALGAELPAVPSSVQLLAPARRRVRRWTKRFAPLARLVDARSACT